MLKISGDGWAKINIGEKVVYEGSYLTDIPLDFLKALYDYFSPNLATDLNIRPSSCVRVDCEGGEAYFVFSNSEYSDKKVFMFCGGKEEFHIEPFNIDPYYLAVELISDIENDFENWVKWFSTLDKKLVRKNLIFWLNKLKKAVMKEKPYSEKFKEWNTLGTSENEKAMKVLKEAVKNLKANDNLPTD